VRDSVEEAAIIKTVRFCLEDFNCVSSILLHRTGLNRGRDVAPLKFFDLVFEMQVKEPQLLGKMLFKISPILRPIAFLFVPPYCC
jgi:hypothetical protein